MVADQTQGPPHHQAPRQQRHCATRSPCLASLRITVLDAKTLIVPWKRAPVQPATLLRASGTVRDEPLSTRPLPLPCPNDPYPTPHLARIWFNLTGANQSAHENHSTSAPRYACLALPVPQPSSATRISLEPTCSPQAKVALLSNASRSPHCSLSLMPLCPAVQFGMLHRAILLRKITLAVQLGMLHRAILPSNLQACLNSGCPPIAARRCPHTR